MSKRLLRNINGNHTERHVGWNHEAIKERKKEKIQIFEIELAGNEKTLTVDVGTLM